MTQPHSARNGRITPAMFRIAGEFRAQRSIRLSTCALCGALLMSMSLGCAFHSQLCGLAQLETVRAHEDTGRLREGLLRSVPLGTSYADTGARILKSNASVIPVQTEQPGPSRKWTVEFDFNRIRVRSDLGYFLVLIGGDNWTIDFRFDQGKLAGIDVEWGAWASP